MSLNSQCTYRKAHTCLTLPCACGVCVCVCLCVPAAFSLWIMLGSRKMARKTNSSFIMAPTMSGSRSHIFEASPFIACMRISLVAISKVFHCLELWLSSGEIKRHTLLTCLLAQVRVEILKNQFLATKRETPYNVMAFSLDESQSHEVLSEEYNTLY